MSPGRNLEHFDERAIEEGSELLCPADTVITLQLNGNTCTPLYTAAYSRIF
jgi:hypothetical protein